VRDRAKEWRKIGEINHRTWLLERDYKVITLSESCLGKYLFFNGLSRYRNRERISFCVGVFIPPVPEIVIQAYQEATNRGYEQDMVSAFIFKIMSDGKTLKILMESDIKDLNISYNIIEIYTIDI
ncbi:hypothetical protein, partial [Xenorhabdus entomophaga]|uniref:hypothetical protein n=1 Tax=Xenorhabdus entomophaga TaxID=3136257 RepID=UPI0030F375FD